MVEVKEPKCPYLKGHYCPVRAKELAYDRNGVHRECGRCREGRRSDGNG